MIRLGTRHLAMGATRSSARVDASQSTSHGRQHAPEDSVDLGRAVSSADGQMESMARIHKAQQMKGSAGQDQRDQLRSALNALPRDASGTVNPDLLVDSDRTMALSEAVERLVLEGLGSGADIAFERAVNQLFVEYADDLALDSDELEQARDQLLNDVRDIVADNEVRPWEPGKPAPAMMNLEKAVEMLQAKVMERRQLMLEASGDLSRVLSELTVQAQNGDEEDIARLGDFLDRFSAAVRARSSSQVREDARERLLSGSPFDVTSPADETLGQAFLSQLESVVGE